MKKFLPIFFITVLSFLGCYQKPTDLSKQAQQEIMTADIAMSDMAAREGFFRTLLSYADTGVVKLKEGEYPVIGKTSLEKYWAGKTDFKTLTWKPFKGEAARSGDIGYTLGKWELAGKDSTFYGNYYTIWKKQTDGTWKFVLDGGNNTPK
jgi:ketosteroid isomerase-like protein